MIGIQTAEGARQLWAALPTGLEGGQALLPALLGFNIVVPTEDLREAILERGSSKQKAQELTNHHVKPFPELMDSNTGQKWMWIC